MRYFKNNYRKMTMPTLFLIIIGFISYSLPLLVSRVNEYASSNIGGLATFLIIIALFVPIYEGRVLKNKRGGDMFYSLPLNKTQLNFKIYLKGLFQIIIAFTVIYSITFILVVIKQFSFKYIYYLPLFFFSLIAVLGYYSFNTFAFSKGNSLVDGIIMVVIYNILPLVVAGAFRSIFLRQYGFYKMSMYMPSSLIFNFSNYYFHKISKPSYVTIMDLKFGLEVLLPSLIWLLISLGLLVSHLFYTKEIKPENIEQKSDSYFAYKILIPTSVFATTIFSKIGYFQSLEIIGAILIFVGAYIGYVIYERSFKVKSQYLLLTVGLIVGAILINIILYRI